MITSIVEAILWSLDLPICDHHLGRITKIGTHKLFLIYSNNVIEFGRNFVSPYREEM